MDRLKDIHDNSRQSYQENERSSKGESYRQQIVSLLKRTGESMTDREIINALNVVDVNNIRPEITRLKQADVLIESGKVKCSITNRTVRTVRLKTKLPQMLF